MPDINVTVCVNTQKAENSVLTFRIIKVSHKKRTKKKKRDIDYFEKNTCSQLLGGMPPVPTGKDHLQPIFYILWSSVWNCKAHLKKLRLKGLRNIVTQVFIMKTLNKFHSSKLKNYFQFTL